MYRRSAIRLITTAIAGLWLALPGGSARADWNPSLVGMWHTKLLLGGSSGPVYDEAFEHFHGDGTHMLVSNGLPPALGNVCIGVYKRTGPRTYKLRHMTWNWSPEMNEAWGVQGTPAGRFELNMTLRLDESGNSYRGVWTVKNFDTDGNHIPGLDAEGVVRGTRLAGD